MEHRLFRPQHRFLSMQGVRKIFLAGRGAGKSVVAGYWCRDRILTVNHRGAIVAPTYGQAQEIVNYLTPLLTTIGEVRYNRKAPDAWRPQIVDFRNVLTFYRADIGCRHVYICSTDNYEAIRGKSLGWFAVDEAALVPEVAYDEVLVPALRGLGPDATYPIALFTSPKGSANWVSRRHADSGWATVRAPSGSNFLEYPPRRIAELQDEMPERSFRQEIDAEILDMGSNQMFYVRPGPAAPDQPEDAHHYISCDQNVSPLTALLAWHHNGHTHVYDEVTIADSAVAADVAVQVRRKVRPGLRLFLTGDSSGNARNVLTRKSFYRALSDALTKSGYSVVDRTLNKNPSVFDSAERVNDQMAKGRLTIAACCRRLRADFEQARYAADLSTDKKHHDPHHGDCLRYLVETLHRPSQAAKARQVL